MSIVKGKSLLNSIPMNAQKLKQRYSLQCQVSHSELKDNFTHRKISSLHKKFSKMTIVENAYKFKKIELNDQNIKKQRKLTKERYSQQFQFNFLSEQYQQITTIKSQLSSVIMRIQSETKKRCLLSQLNEILMKNELNKKFKQNSKNSISINSIRKQKEHQIYQIKEHKNRQDQQNSKVKTEILELRKQRARNQNFFHQLSKQIQLLEQQYTILLSKQSILKKQLQTKQNQLNKNNQNDISNVCIFQKESNHRKKTHFTTDTPEQINYIQSESDNFDNKNVPSIKNKFTSIKSIEVNRGCRRFQTFKSLWHPSAIQLPQCKSEYLTEILESRSKIKSIVQEFCQQFMFEDSEFIELLIEKVATLLQLNREQLKQQILNYSKQKKQPNYLLNKKKQENIQLQANIIQLQDQIDEIFKQKVEIDKKSAQHEFVDAFSTEQCIQEELKNNLENNRKDHSKTSQQQLMGNFVEVLSIFNKIPVRANQNKQQQQDILNNIEILSSNIFDVVGELIKNDKNSISMMTSTKIKSNLSKQTTTQKKRTCANSSQININMQSAIKRYEEAFSSVNSSVKQQIKNRYSYDSRKIEANKLNQNTVTKRNSLSQLEIFTEKALKNPRKSLKMVTFHEQQNKLSSMKVGIPPMKSIKKISLHKIDKNLRKTVLF